MKVILPENEVAPVAPTDTSPVKLTPAALLSKAALKAKELARLRQLLSREGRQQLRKVSKQNLKSKNRRRKAIATRSRKRNR
jgi:hypothetical protein